MQRKGAFHSKIQRLFQSVDRVPPAVRIARVIRLRDATYQVNNTALPGECSGKSQEDEITPRNEGIRQFVAGGLIHRDARIRQGIATQRRKRVDRQGRVHNAGMFRDLPGTIEFNAMPLAVIEGQRLDPASAKSIQCPIQAGC